MTFLLLPTRFTEPIVRITTVKSTSGFRVRDVTDSSVISSVKMVDGILKVDASSNVDLSESVDDLLRKPVVIDFAKVWRFPPTFLLDESLRRRAG